MRPGGRPRIAPVNMEQLHLAVASVQAAADAGSTVTQADETLAKFLDFCTYGHMIDNVVLIVTGTLHERDVQVRGPGGLAT